jgi:hypothetical protein
MHDYYSMVQYGTVRLVRRTEEEKYGTVRYGHLGSTATP